MRFDITWLVTLLVGVPLAIAANILTPKVRDWWAKQTARRAKERIEDLRVELAEAAILARSSVRELLCDALVRIVVAAMVFTLASAMAVFALSIASGNVRKLTAALSTAGYVCAALLGQRLLVRCRRSSRYPEYERGIQNTISALASAHPTLTTEDGPDVPFRSRRAPTYGGFTALLFPFVTNVCGDTAIYVANATADPFGTPHAWGTCTIHYFGSRSGDGTPIDSQTTQTIPPGGNLAFTVGIGGMSVRALRPGFVGYVIITCDFPRAYGYAAILDKAQNVQTGYVAEVLVG